MILRNKVIRIRVTPDEHEQIRRAAAADGRTISDWIRRRLNSGFLTKGEK